MSIAYWGGRGGELCAKLFDQVLHSCDSCHKSYNIVMKESTRFWSIWAGCLYFVVFGWLAKALTFYIVSISNLWTNFFHLCHTYRPWTSTILYHFQWLWPGVGVTRSMERKTSWACILAHFFNWSGYLKLYGVQAIQVKHFCTVLSEIWWIKENNCCF